MGWVECWLNLVDGCGMFVVLMDVGWVLIDEVVVVYIDN